MKNKNNFYILNNIIYNIYNMENFEEMKLQLLLDLKHIVPNVCASLFMSDPDNNYVLREPLCHPPHFTQMENRYMLVRDKDFSDWITRRKNPFIIRMSDMIEDEEREQTEYYKLAYEPYGVHHVVYVTIASRNQTLGLLALYRKKEDEDFDEGDIFWLELLNEHLNQRFYQEVGIKEKSGAMAPDEYQLMQTYQLTMRELEIVHLILEGKTNDQIWLSLGISLNTLKKHLQNIYRKTGVKSRKSLMTLLAPQYGDRPSTRRSPFAPPHRPPFQYL